MATEHEKPTSVAFTIVGDSYVDLFCFLDGSPPELGGDSALTEPVQTYAGGSTINTATHLCMLLRTRPCLHEARTNEDSDSDSILASRSSDTITRTRDVAALSSSASVSVQTMLNPNDEYGQILLRHAVLHNFQVVNCYCKSKETNANGSDMHSSSSPHCVVMVSRHERSFMSHRGCATYFTAWDLQLETMLETNGPVHLHVAGFFCTPGFGNQSLRDQLLSLRSERHKRWPDQPTLVSVVTQFDVTQKWDAGLVHDIIPLLSCLIMNDLEARKIINQHTSTQTPEDEDISEEALVFFSALNMHATFVVTKGVNGAIAFRNGKIIGRVGPSAIVTVIDPTGAGDAFAAGFLYGLWGFHEETSSADEHNFFSDEAVYRALLWGCTVGTAAVTIRGASVPSTPDFIEKIHARLLLSNTRNTDLQRQE